jgi:hypothetical protein
MERNKKNENIQEKKIELAQFINSHAFQIISSVDTKASIIVAINGVILGLLFQSEVLQDRCSETRGWNSLSVSSPVSSHTLSVSSRSIMSIGNFLGCSLFILREDQLVREFFLKRNRAFGLLGKAFQT